MGKQDKYALAGIVSIIIIFLMIGFYALHLNGKADVNRDAASNCVESPPGHYIAIVDQTDKISLLRQESIKKSFENIKRSIRTDESLAIYSIDAMPAVVPTAHLKMCANSTVNDTSSLTGNKLIVKERFEKTFGADLAVYLKKLSLQKKEVTSPIIEVLDSITKIGFYANSKDAKKNVYIFSDFLQNSQLVSFYGNTNLVALEKNLKLMDLLQNMDLNNYNFKLFFLTDCKYYTNQILARNFWSNFLKSKNAQFVFEQLVIEGGDNCTGKTSILPEEQNTSLNKKFLSDKKPPYTFKNSIKLDTQATANSQSSKNTPNVNKDTSNPAVSRSQESSAAPPKTIGEGIRMNTVESASNGQQLENINLIDKNSRPTSQPALTSSTLVGEEIKLFLNCKSFTYENQDQIFTYFFHKHGMLTGTLDFKSFNKKTSIENVSTGIWWVPLKMLENDSRRFSITIGNVISDAFAVKKIGSNVEFTWRGRFDDSRVVRMFQYNFQTRC